LFIKKLKITNEKFEWIYLLVSYITYCLAHLKILGDSLAYVFMAVTLAFTLAPIFYFKVKPSIFATGLLSYILVLYWLFIHKGYYQLDIINIIFPYLLCAAGVSTGIVITAVRQQELKFSTLRSIIEAAFFTIAIGFWPVYPRLLHQFN